MTWKVGSFCTGALGLDMAVLAAIGGELVWTAENDPDCIKIIEERAPGVPNHGDITKLDWATLEPVEIMCGGWPCQPVSGAGKQKGMKDERWIWPYIAAGIGRMVTPPRLLVLENVPRLLTADGGAALAQVTYTLAALGYVGRYGLLRASTSGACHKRERWFCIAVHRDAANTPATDWRGSRAAGAELDWHPAVGDQAGAQPGDSDQPAAYPALAGSQGWILADGQRAPQPARTAPGPWRGEPAPGAGQAAANGHYPEQSWQRGEQPGRAAAAWGGDQAVPYPTGEPGKQWRWPAGEQAAGGWAQPVGGGPAAGPAAYPADGGGQAWLTQPAPQPRGHDADGRGDQAGPGGASWPGAHQGGQADVHAEGQRWGMGGGRDGQGAEGFERGLGPAERDALARTIEGCDDFEGWCPDEPGRVHTTSGYCCTLIAFVQLQLALAEDDEAGTELAYDIDWQEYEPAVRRWELVSGRPAPCPVEEGKNGKPRLAARFAEWMMGWPDGWVTGVPGLSRGAQLRAIGNGVLPQQAIMAIQALWQPVD